MLRCIHQGCVVTTHSSDGAEEGKQRSLSGHSGVEWSRSLALCPESSGWRGGGASAVPPLWWCWLGNSNSDWLFFAAHPRQSAAESGRGLVFWSPGETCLCGFTPVPSHGPKTCTIAWLEPLNRRQWVSECVVCDWLVTCPGRIPVSHPVNAGIDSPPKLK